MTTTIPTPRNSDELAEMLADPNASKEILATKDSLKTFIDAYAGRQQGDGTEIQRQVEIETQKQLANMLRDNEQKSDRDSIKRLNLNPQTQPANMLTSHRQALSP